MFKAVMLIFLMNAQGDGFEGQYPARPYPTLKACLDDKTFLENTVEEGQKVKIVCIVPESGQVI